MDAALGVALGLVLLSAGVSILVDFRSFGTRLVGLSLYTSAPVWKRDARPPHEKVRVHRLLFGSSVTAISLLIVGSSASGLF